LSHVVWYMLPVMPHVARCSCTASIAAEKCRLAARADRERWHPCGEEAPEALDGETPGRLIHRASGPLQGALRAPCALVASGVRCPLPAHIWPQLPHPTPTCPDLHKDCAQPAALICICKALGAAASAPIAVVLLPVR
jgi:hypothetical protein